MKKLIKVLEGMSHEHIARVMIAMASGMEHDDLDEFFDEVNEKRVTIKELRKNRALFTALLEAVRS